MSLHMAKTLKKLFEQVLEVKKKSQKTIFDV
jgi:hypothetical protein